MEEVRAPEGRPIRLLEWLIKEDDWVKYGVPLAVYRHIEDPSKGVKSKEMQLRSKNVGRVKKLALQIGQVATPGCILIELESCSHPVVMKDMCAECGQDLRLLAEKKGDKCARVSMVPSIPELKISAQQAEELGNQDKDRLHKLKKLVLLVDLDQTLIHTTQNQTFASMCKNTEDFYTFQLQKNEPTLYTKLRPHCREFLEKISQHFELQIVTFGSRQYAHKIAEFIDPKSKYFAHRILSRDECINPMKKSGNLRHLFPCGDSMVCIIDDRDDVWSAIPNLVLVKKYSYFPGAGDINSPDKTENKKRKPEKNNIKSDESAKTSPRKRKSAEEINESAQSCKIMKTTDNTTDNMSIDADELMKSIDQEVKSETSAQSISKTTEQNETQNGSSIIHIDLNQEEVSSSDNACKKTCEDITELLLTDATNNDNTTDNDKTTGNKVDCTVLPSDNVETIGKNPTVDDIVSSQISSISVDTEDSSTSSSSSDSSSSSSSRSQKVETGTDNSAESRTPQATENGQKLQNHNNTDGKTDHIDMEVQPANSDVPKNEVTETSENGRSDNILDFINESSPANLLENVDSSSTIADKSSIVTDTDDYLKYLQDVLMQIHTTYYEAYDKFANKEYEHSPDLRGVVPFLRSKVLYGCYIVLTGIIPNNFKGAPHQHKACITARQLGATIDEKVSERTTHLIGGKKGTNKYQDARKTGDIHLVAIEWLWSCSERWERVSESLFPIPDRRDNSACNSREGTPPVSKGVKFDGTSSVPRTYNPITGKLIKKVCDPRFEFMVTEAVTRHQKRVNPIYSSLKDPEVVVPVQPELPNEPGTSSAGKVRTRKPSMADMMGIGYSLSSYDIADMDKEVDDLLSSDDENTLGSLIERVVSSSSEDSQPTPSSSDKIKDDKLEEAADSSSSEEEFDHMAELLDHEMHYDEDNSDLDTLD